MPSRVISARPRVIRVDLLFWPISMPSEMPAPRAMMFFRVPPSSTPVTSSLVYTRNLGDISVSWTSAVRSGFRPATTVADGFSSAISLARLGPERTQMPSCISGGSSSSITWLMRLPSGVSSPLEALTTVASGVRCSAMD